MRRATVSDAAPANFFTPGETAGKCVACHTLSRNGRKLAANVGGEKLGVVDVANLAPPVIDWALGYDGGWMTFNPDTSRLVQARKGVMVLRDGTSGAPVGPNDGVVPLPAGRYGTYPDWSPDGSNLLFTLSASAKTRGISAGNVARIPYQAGTWGTVETLVASGGNADSNHYPMYSFDGQWIAFVKASGSSDNNDTAKLYLLPAAGGMPRYLDRLNQIVSDADLGPAAQLGNSMPTWAPSEPGDFYFVAFTSKRAYGLVYGEGAREQLWVAAIDPSSATGAGASFPAFRLPFQDLEEDNHRPFWAVDVLAPPPDAGVPDAAPPDAGAPDAAPDAPACLPAGASCVSGRPCCEG